MTSNDLAQGVTENVIPLLFGHPDPATLLTPELHNAVQQVIGSPLAYRALQYGPEQGTQSLIQVLAEKIRREQGVAISPANLMIVAGSTHAVDMLTRLYVGAGNVMLVEAPTYADALHIFRDQRVELCAIPMDEQGLIPEELARQLERLQAHGTVPRILYTIPNFHNPMGCTLPEGRRREIIQLAHEYGFLIVEDDVYRDLSFDGTVPASFYALAEGKQVLSIGSFSKTLAPGLRLGWLLAPEEMIQRCVYCGTTQMGGGANPFVANIVASYCQSGSWEKHVLSLRSLYQRRCEAALAALKRYMPAGVSWTSPTGGFFIWLNLPEHVLAQEVKRLAFQQGVSVAAGEGFFVYGAEGAHHLRLAFSCATPDEIDRGIRILAEVIQRPLNN